MTDSSEPVFDLIAQQYDEVHAENAGQVEATTELLAHLPEPATILDVGCGTGLPVARLVIEAGHQYIGLDISKGMLERGRANRWPGAVFLQGDVRDMPRCINVVEAVVAHFSLLMLSRREIERSLDVIREALKPGGFFSLAMVDFDADSAPVDFMGVTFEASGYSADSLRSILVERGFNILSLRVYRHKPVAGGEEAQLFVLARREPIDAPMPSSTTSSVGVIEASARFAFEVGSLKHMQRSGWALARSSAPDSVAAHSFRVGLLSMLLAALAGEDVQRVALLGLIHDLHEARIGDLNHLARLYLSEDLPRSRVVEQQTAGIPAQLSTLIRDASGEFSNRSTVAGSLARDADAIEALLHVKENLSADPLLQDQWLEYLAKRVRTTAGKRLVGAILSVSADAWWTDLVNEGGEG